MELSKKINEKIFSFSDYFKNRKEFGEDNFV